MGDLSVEIKVYADEGCTERFGDIDLDDGVEDELSMLEGKTIFISVLVEKAQGIPPEFSQDVFVKFSFWPEENSYEVPRCKNKTINPVFNHTKVFAIQVTKDFINHVQQTALEFDLIGSRGSANPANAMHSISSSGVNSNNEAMRIAELEAKLAEMKVREEEFERFRNVITSNPEARKHVEKAMETAGVNPNESSICTVM